MVTLGVEEEVFVCEPCRPSLKSFLYLSKLLARNPRYYYFHTASNFARGKDILSCLVSGIEISTGVHTNVQDLTEDLKARRKDLISVTEGLIVPLGHLIDVNSPTNICALHVHLGIEEIRRELVYNNLAYFLPLLILAAANSPYRKGEYFGQSYRMHSGYALGPLVEDPLYRFQDLIISRRFKTIEIRVFDSIWEMARISQILSLILQISEVKKKLPFNREKYRILRHEVVRSGWIPDLEPVYERLRKISPVPKDFFAQTPADTVARLYQKYGLIPTYSALDNAYREGELLPRRVEHLKRKRLPSLAGFLFYYPLKGPYNLWKYWKEWYG